MNVRVLVISVVIAAISGYWAGFAAHGQICFDVSYTTLGCSGCQDIVCSECHLGSCSGTVKICNLVHHPNFFTVTTAATSSGPCSAPAGLHDCVRRTVEAQRATRAIRASAGRRGNQVLTDMRTTTIRIAIVSQPDEVLRETRA